MNELQELLRQLKHEKSGRKSLVVADRIEEKVNELIREIREPK